MHPVHLEKIWRVLGAATALLSIVAISQSQGGPVITGAFLIEERPSIASYFFIFILSSFLFVVCTVGVLYAGSVPSPTWSGRLPMVGEDPDHPSARTARSTKIYQGFFIAAFVLLPAYAIGHLNRVVLNQAVVWNEDAGPDNAVAVKYTFLGGTPDIQAKAAATFRPKSDGTGPHLWLADRVHDPQRSASETYKTQNPRDLSTACAKDRRACRGVDWPHPWPLVGMALFTGASWIAVVWFLVAIRPKEPGKPLDPDEEHRSSPMPAPAADP
jgi:hypothetical protein